MWRADTIARAPPAAAAHARQFERVRAGVLSNRDQQPGMWRVGPLIVGILGFAAAREQPLPKRTSFLGTTTAPPPKKGCHGGSCGGMAHYPVSPGTVYEAVFDVPGKPAKSDGICFYIYFNIFFSGKGDGQMNQCASTPSSQYTSLH